MSEDLERQLRILRTKLTRSDEHRRSLEELRDRSDHMHRTIIREMELSQKKLLESEARALEANRSKSAFLANMSHEIRTPMNGVLGMAQLLLDSELNGEQQTLATTLFQSAETLLGLLDDVLDFSKIEANELAIESIRFDLHDLLEQVTRTFSAPATERGLVLVCDLDRNVPVEIIGDPKRTRQVVTNLLSNAIKFTESGRVSLRAFPNDEGVTIEVTDSGIGIAPDAQSRIFDSFRQADYSTTRRYGGSGLGLTISRQLAERMGGTLTVESDVGNGSRFTFTLVCDDGGERVPLLAKDGRRARLDLRHAEHSRVLRRYLGEFGIEVVTSGEADFHVVPGSTDTHPGPGPTIEVFPSHLIPRDLDRRVLGVPLCRSELRQVLQHTEPLTAVAPTPALTFPGRRVLVAEDSPVNRAVIVRMLSKLEIEATCVGDGASAVEAWRKGNFDLILMDYQMPWMDGVQATRRIRTLAGTLPIIALTASVLAGDRERCYEAGMTGFLSKPFTLQQVRAVLAEALGEP